MANLFSGLEAFGLGKMEDLDVYASNEKGANPSEASGEKAVITEADFLFDKTFNCPVCEKEFKSKMVRTGKVKLISADTDLRPKYQNLDSLKYDAVVCPHCGYSALSRFFNYMTSPQAKLIRENISSSFKGLEDEGDIYNYDQAIARHKLSLVNTIVKRGKLSERAYTCLKTAWLLRGKAEFLTTEADNEGKDNSKEIKELYAEEVEFLKNAYSGFEEAFSKEMFPMCGMDEITITYLMADVARRIGKYDESSRWISKVLISRNANDRIKEKARDIKELLRQTK